MEKLIPNLWDKKKYIVHHENLKLYLELGLKVKKIHRGIKFREEPWMRSYIELNTDLRTKGKNDFEKDFFKLMNNSVFGKTMENIRNRVDVKLVNNRGAAEKLSAKPNFEHLTIFDENLVAVHMKRTKLTFNKPVYCGMAILDLSKSLMYDFHYGYILPKYGKIKTSSSLIRILSAMRLRLKIFSRIFQGMWKRALTRAIFQKIIRVKFLLEKTKKSRV